MLKSFITVFIQYNEGLENKLTRAPLLDLAKSIFIAPITFEEIVMVMISIVSSIILLMLQIDS